MKWILTALAMAAVGALLRPPWLTATAVRERAPAAFGVGQVLVSAVGTVHRLGVR